MKKILSSLIVCFLALTLCANGATKATKQAKAIQKAQIKKEKEFAKAQKKHAKDLKKGIENQILSDAQIPRKNKK